MNADRKPGAPPAPAEKESATPTRLPAIELHSVNKRFGAVRAVDDVSLVVRAGEFLTLLGPSGCGKTTLLRIIAGFEAPDSGRVELGGEDVTHRPPHLRNVNQVFQSYALFPHLSVRDNIGFGLRMQRQSRQEIERRVAEAVTLVSLGGCEDRMPHQLSGGQRQRVALARALAPRPAVLLLDEPLSALDARLRQGMQLELKRLQRQVGTTFIFVTHDQEEALTLSDRIALIHEGRVVQCGSGHEIYHRPATEFAAEFIGHANIFEAELIGTDDGAVKIRLEGGLELRIRPDCWPAARPRAKVSIRAEKIRVSRSRITAENGFEAHVEQQVFKGAIDRLLLVSTSGTRLTAIAMNEGALQPSQQRTDQVWCAIDPADVFVIE